MFCTNLCLLFVNFNFYVCENLIEIDNKVHFDVYVLGKSQFCHNTKPIGFCNILLCKKRVFENLAGHCFIVIFYNLFLRKLKVQFMLIGGG